MTQRATQAFGHGSISLGLHLEPVDPPNALQELLRQARLARSVGFDGVTLSEHHAAFDGYLPTPILGVSWILDALDSGWAAPCPMLLPLRPTNLMLEDLAWLASRYPGRLGVGFAPGFAAEDFALAQVPPETRRAEHYARLELAAKALRGHADGLLSADTAIHRCAEFPVPVLGAVAGPVAARHAARVGAGILIAIFKNAAQAAELSAIYRDNGGTHARVLIRRCWLGPPPSSSGAPSKASHGRKLAPPAEWASGERDSLVTARTAGEMVEQLHQVFVEGDITALNLRVNLPDNPVSATREQIRRLGTEVLPALRERITATGRAIQRSVDGGCPELAEGGSRTLNQGEPDDEW